MKSVPYSLYLLPGRHPKERPYKSSWKMSPAEAAAIGALYPIAGTTEHRDMPDTEAETQAKQFGYPSAGIGGVQPPRT